MPESPSAMCEIEFNDKKIRQFRKAYKQAVKAEEPIFIFEERELDTRYAGYLLEFLDLKSGKNDA